MERNSISLNMKRNKTYKSNPVDKIGEHAKQSKQLKILELVKAASGARGESTPGNKSNTKLKTTSKNKNVLLVKLTKQQKRDLKRNAQAKEARKLGLLDQPFQNSSTQSSLAQESSGGSISGYRRKSTYPSLYLSDEQKNQVKNNIPHNRFLTESDAGFKSIVHSSFSGYCYSPAESFSNSFHSKFERAMIGLEMENKYQYDVTQPARLGTKTDMTHYSTGSCVVGEPGTTYKCLGLRMFSIPWVADCVGSSAFAVDIRKFNQTMIKKSQEHLSARGEEACGSCQYNLTLINR